MKNFTVLLTIILIVLAAMTGWLWSRVGELEKSLDDAREVDLYTVMNNMQDQAHKLYYSVEEENAELTDFYLHELEESAEDLIEANVFYHGQPVGMLTRTMLLPVIEEMEGDLEDGYWDQLREKRSVLVRACNDCHGATGYGAIVITERGIVNPYNQDFRPKR